MNYIKITDNLEPFELKSSQEWYTALKSLLMFDEFNKVISDSDEFIIEKQPDDILLLKHKSHKTGKTKPILAFRNTYVSMEKIFNVLPKCLEIAWAEYLF